MCIILLGLVDLHRMAFVSCTRGVSRFVLLETRMCANLHYYGRALSGRLHPLCCPRHGGLSSYSHMHCRPSPVCFVLVPTSRPNHLSR